MHYISLTFDTDPDGLSGITANRNASSFVGLEEILSLPYFLSDNFKKIIPFTWFIRIDDQIEKFCGDSFFLFEKYYNKWREFESLGHELAWHPHIYEFINGEYKISIDDSFNCDALEKTWQLINKRDLKFYSFRNGEGWHTIKTFATLESFGILNDSTAIPGISRMPEHPINWLDSPQQPYFPDKNNLNKVASKEGSLIEIPMSSWLTKTGYDKATKIRYMNLAVKKEYFSNWLRGIDINSFINKPFCWNFVCHPDELMKSRKGDLLFSGNQLDFYINLQLFIEKINSAGICYEFVTINQIGNLFRSKWSRK